ncbi:MAG: hypothetical protein KDB54_04920 [Solirubrobacterales bacterium]|nr:hypothetical protein [Solirubrobacterales bacterium]
MTLSRRHLTIAGRRLLVAALCLVLVTPAVVLVPAPEHAQANVCDAPLIGTGCEVGSWVGNKVGGGAADLITNPTEALTGGVKGLAGVIGGQVGKAVSKAIKNGTKGVFDQLTEWVGTAAGWLFLKVVALISNTTSPDLFHQAFLVKYRQILALAAILTAGVVAMAVIEGGRRGDVGQLTSMLVGGLPTAVLGMVAGIAIIQLSLNLVDTLSAGVAEATKSDIQKWFEAGAKWMVKGLTHSTAAGTGGGNAQEVATNAAASATPGFVLFISELLAVIGAFGLWIELLMRDAAIYVCALFLPLGLAASVWPRWSGVLRKTFEILVCLIVSKFMIVMVISLAASFLGKPDGVESLLAGSAMMIVALLCPFMLLKVIPFMEGVMLTSGATGMARSAASTGSQVSLMRYHMGHLGSGGGGGGSGAGSYGPFGPSGASQAQTAAATGAGAGVGAGASAGAGAAAAPATAGASVAVAAAGQAAGAASRAGQAHAAAPIDAAASAGSAPRPASTGDQQQTPARSAESVASPATDPARPSPARSQTAGGAPGREQSGQPGKSDVAWRPSSGADPTPAPELPASGASQASDASSPGPPIPDEPKPRRTEGA